MNHDCPVLEAVSMPLLPAGEEKTAHARGHTEAEGVDGRGDVLHGIVDGQTGTDAAPGRVDVQFDGTPRVLGFEKEELRGEKGRDLVHHLVRVSALDTDRVERELTGPRKMTRSLSRREYIS